jgi:SH3-like domain-containing protein
MRSVAFLAALAVAFASSLAHAKKTSDENTHAAGPAEPVCVVRPHVSLRKGPGKEFGVSWAVPKYMPLLKIDKKGAWFKVQDLEGENHWVSATSVSKKTMCAVVKTKTAKLRQGPGPEHPLAELSSVDRYTPFRKIDRDGEWIQVKDDFNGTYWVHETNVWIPVVRSKLSF